jgi:hypothetical protein
MANASLTSCYDLRSDSPISYESSKPALLSTLSASQIDAFIELRELCEKNDRFWSRSTTERKTNPDFDDDVTLLYVRADGLVTMYSTDSNHLGVISAHATMIPKQPSNSIAPQLPGGT